MRQFTFLATAFAGQICFPIFSRLGLSSSENDATIAPKVMIVTHYGDEQNIWTGNSGRNSPYGTTSFGSLLDHKIPVPGLSPQFPNVYCTGTGEVCLMVTGEGMSHAASSTSALSLSPLFDFRKTYWIAFGTAGGKPGTGMLGDFTLARFTGQPSLQYELGGADIPVDFGKERIGYFPWGTTHPDATTGFVYDSEVFEFNTELIDAVLPFMNESALVDTDAAKQYRAQYRADYSRSPVISKCDVLSTDTWISGDVVMNSFEERFKKWTNESAIYCSNAQEDGSMAGALVKAHLSGKVDFSRVIVTRQISDMDRPYPGQTAVDNLLNAQMVGYNIAVINAFMGGNPIIMGILENWERTFKKGIQPKGYIGDIWATMGGTPDFLDGRQTGGRAVDIPTLPGDPVTLDGN